MPVDPSSLPRLDVADSLTLHENHVGHVGLLPYAEEGTTRLYLMTAPTAKPDRDPPKIQIAKGHREVRPLKGGAWADREEESDFPGDGNESEPVWRGAWREGEEELGVREAWVLEAHHLGVHALRKQTRRTLIPTLLIAARLDGRHDGEMTPTQSDKHLAPRWVTLAEFLSVGREDQRDVLVAIDAALACR